MPINSPVRLAGAVALCAALLLSACAKKTETTSSSTDATATATAAPDAASTGAAAPGETTAPAADASAPASAATSAATSSASTTTTPVTASNGAGSGKFIELPIYPGAAEAKDQGMTLSANDTSLVMKVYTTKDDAKKVADWYKSHLPASWKGGVLTSGDKTVGSFSEEHPDGDQTVIVANQTDGETRIQLSTKHGK